VITWLVRSTQEPIEGYVLTLRAQNRGITDEALARKIVRRKSFKNGLWGALTGVPGIIGLPVTVPADLIASWKIQITMALAIARVYGHTPETTDLKTDIYLILAGDAAREALKQAGVKVGKEITKRVIDKLITRELMKKIWKVVGRKIITKAGHKSLFSFTKMVPLVGAPIGFAFNWTAARLVGRVAIRYYSGKG
jgi:hypothetical protein